jgi:hypothetical protein
VSEEQAGIVRGRPPKAFVHPVKVLLHIDYSDKDSLLRAADYMLNLTQVLE